MQGLLWRGAVLVALVIPGLCFGQEARLFGTVSDPAGSAVPDAQVKITATATGITVVVVTGPEGNYVAPQLVAGRYDIEVLKTGFVPARVSGVLIRTNESVRSNVQLALGTVGTTVNVEARRS